MNNISKTIKKGGINIWQAIKIQEEKAKGAETQIEEILIKKALVKSRALSN